VSRHIVTVAAIVSIAAIEGLAIPQGMNGIILSSTIGVIAGLAGFVAGKKKQERG